MISGYHSEPYSSPCVPDVSDERKDLSIPQVTLLSNVLNASARAASRVSWLMKTSAFCEGIVSGVSVPLSTVVGFLPLDMSYSRREWVSGRWRGRRSLTP